MTGRGTRFRRLIWGRTRWHRRPGTLRALTPGLLLLGLLLGMLLVAFWPRHRLYTLNIVSEIVSLVVTDPLYAEWDLQGAAAYLDPWTEQAHSDSLPEGTLLQVNRGVQVELQRHGGGPLRIRLSAEQGGVGRLLGDAGRNPDLGAWALFILPVSERPRLLPFRGQLTIGDDVTNQVDSILLEGRVSIIEEKLFSHGHYTAGEGLLETGDRVRLWSRAAAAPGGQAASQLDGFIRAAPQAPFDEPMRLIAHGQVDFAEIVRFGSAGYEVGTQAWTRFVNDPVLGVLLAMLASLALLLELFFKLLTFRETLAPPPKRTRK